MTSRELRVAEWASYFDAMSRTHRGTRASVETISREVGVLANATNLPFMGITYEREGAAADGVVEVLLGGPSDAHVSHTVAHPTAVRVCEGADRLSAVVQVESLGGPTTLVYVGVGADALAPGFVSDDLILASKVVRAKGEHVV